MRNNIFSNYDIKSCCGCLSCVNVCPNKAIYKSKDKFGFIIPKYDDSKCVDCGLCIKVCPYELNPEILNKPLITYAASNRNESILLKSSSGGIFFSLAEKIISEGGVVFGATMDASFRVFHIAVKEIENLNYLVKSKYIQSDLGDTFIEVKKILNDGIKVLYVGTPCQISALITYLMGKPKNLITVDLVCHGVPNNDFFNDYLNCLKKKIGEIKKYEFRKKKSSQNGMNCYISYSNKKREYIRNWPEDSFSYFYMMGYIYRDSCYECKFAKSKRVSDITLCDYWNWEKRHKDAFRRNSSVSGIIVNSEKGNELIDKIKQQLNFVLSDYDFLKENNGCLTNGTSKPLERDVILEKWYKEGYDSVDTSFRKNNRLKRFKYRILMYLPESIKHLLRG